MATDPLVARWAKNRRFFNAYGPTEVTVCATIAECTADYQKPSIGRPIANTQIYLLDQHMQLVPRGVPGEIYIGGTGVARGYLHQPDLTAELFVPDPFSADPGARLYKTGDLARYRADGMIEFLGRLDHQVKVRGFRIELREIESVLNQHPAVREVVVLAHENSSGEKQLVAYLVIYRQQVPTSNELRAFLRKQLPDYMMPSAFVKLDSLPLTLSGKVDRRALPMPDHMQPESESNFVAPRTPVEEVLAGIWAEVLSFEQVGVHDSFFSLGGHSLLATQILSRIHDAFTVKLSMRHLFEMPTVAEFSRYVQAKISFDPQIPPIERISRDKDICLSFAQEGLWFLDQVIPSTHLFNMSYEVRFTGPISIGAFEQSINEIIRRHEILRTTFTKVNGRPVQVIASTMSSLLTVMDLQALPANEREVEMRRLAVEDALRPFDLIQGPLLRVSLLRMDREEHVVIFTMHHIIGDGWSMGVLNRELTVLYDAYIHGRLAPLAELSIQYADFARWQRQCLREQFLESQLLYWKKQLDGMLPMLELPVDRSRSARDSFWTSRRNLVLSKTLSEELKSLSRKEHATLFMTLLAAFNALLYLYTGQVDVRVGTLVANRTRVETEELIGIFVNTLILRTDLSGDPVFRELLRRVREVALGAYANQDLPFEHLVRTLESERSLIRTSLIQVMIVFQNILVQPPKLSGLTQSSLKAESGTEEPVVTLTTFDLILIMGEGPDGIELSLKYKTDLFDATTIDGMLKLFQDLPEEIILQPEQRLSTLLSLLRH